MRRMLPPGGIGRSGGDRDRGPDSLLRRPEGIYAQDRPGVWQAIRRMYGAKTRSCRGGLSPARSRKHRGGRS